MPGLLSQVMRVRILPEAPKNFKSINMVMKIGFYGHSYCAFKSEESFLNIFAKKINAEILNTGVRQGSEERILYELKKTKNLDLAIIFHSYPSYLFLPGSDRDFDLKGVINRHAENIWQSFEIEKISSGWDYHLENHKQFIDKFKNLENFVIALNNYKEYFYDPDLQLNRFYGSLIQIDQYLKNKNLLSIHIVEKNYLPNWFKFTSGIEDNSILDIITDNKLSENDEWCANGITPIGNKKVADRLYEIYAACSR